MTGNIPPSERGKASFTHTTPTALHEKTRAEYRPSTQTFVLKGAGESKKIEHMAQVEENVSKFKVPPDRSSSTYLQNIKSKITVKGNKLSSNTQGVGAYISGNASLYKSFIGSLKQAL